MTSGADRLADDWQPPSEVDLVKELNAHAGRLATLLGLPIAASTFSLSNGALRNLVATFSQGPPFSWGLVGALVALVLDVVYLAVAIVVMTYALEPAVPVDSSSRDAWFLFCRESGSRLCLPACEETPLGGRNRPGAAYASPALVGAVAPLTA